jgi:structure-specific recognition protein 1
MRRGDDRETLAQKYEGNLKLHYDDPAFEVISNLFRVLAAKKVTTSGNYQSYVHLPSSPSFFLPLGATLTSELCSHEGQSAVKCNVKANEGQLYFLEKQLLFISKQPLLVAHSDIHSVTFARSVPPLLPTTQH